MIDSVRSAGPDSEAVDASLRVATNDAVFSDACASTGASTLPERSRMRANAAPAPVVATTTAATEPSRADRRAPAAAPTAEPSSAVHVGMTCHRPNSTELVATAAGVERLPQRDARGARPGR